MEETNPVVAQVESGQKAADEPQSEIPALSSKQEPDFRSSDQQVDESKKEPSSNTTWFNWFSRAERGLPVHTDVSVKPNTDTVETSHPEESLRTDDSKSDIDKTAQKETQEAPTLSNRRVWLQIWGTDSSPRPSSAPPSNRTAVGGDKPDAGAAGSATQQRTTGEEGLNSQTQEPVVTSQPPALPGDGNKSSGWVFWSRDHNVDGLKQSTTGARDGEIAVSDTPSQHRPRRASLTMPDTKEKPKQDLKAKNGIQERSDSPASSIKSKRGRKAATSKDAGSSELESAADATKIESPNAAATAKPPVDAPAAEKKPSVSKKPTKNLLLPSFQETFVSQQSPSIIEQIRRLLYYTKASEPKHLSLIRDPPRIKHALAIGVHGYFPAPFLRTVLGQPTGTSIKFADMAAKAIQRWTDGRGYECHVKSAALEGEGRIAERIGLLWKLLLNWIDEIRKADFILVACHSQGVPVAIMLVAKLIHFGCVNNSRVGICAMAGVNMGPFPDYKSRWISGSAGELFEFSDPTTKVSTDYLAALETVLKSGVHISFTGSIDDQLVSLESALYSPISHPHIYRAVLIDSRIHAPNFLSHLVGFALKLRNLGVPDHGLIRELSPPLAGSLYSGEGHSIIYEDEAVYDLAVAFALETNSIDNASLSQRPNAASVSNPYILPFAMRGILEEEYVKNDLQNETSKLLQEFDEWKPTTKVLKDVKYRLEGIRSRL